MSNSATLMLGLAGGLALWRLAPGARTALRNAGGGTCEIHLDANGLAIDGETVDIDEAVRRAQLGGLANVTVTPDAPAYLCSTLITRLQHVGVSIETSTPAHSRRNADAETSSSFTLVTYPKGVGGARKMHWFRTNAPMTWRAVRAQLAAAKLLDLRAIAPNQAGYWKLVTDPRVFMPMRAKPLPSTSPRRSRDAARTPRYSLEGGRVITRDGQPLVRLERVDLGDGRHALSPHETDELGARLVQLLIARGAQ